MKIYHTHKYTPHTLSYTPRCTREQTQHLLIKRDSLFNIFHLCSQVPTNVLITRKTFHDGAECVEHIRRFPHQRTQEGSVLLNKRCMRLHLVELVWKKHILCFKGIDDDIHRDRHLQVTTVMPQYFMH